MSDLIGITETKQQIEKDFIANVDINDCHLYTQPSKGAAGGVAIYANNKLNHFRRENLDTVNNEFESIWIEVRNNNGKNFLCDCAYRHPNSDISNFIEYVESTFTKVNKDKYVF